jgi:hypothetical protein
MQIKDLAKTAQPLIDARLLAVSVPLGFPVSATETGGPKGSAATRSRKGAKRLRPGHGTTSTSRPSSTSSNGACTRSERPSTTNSAMCAHDRFPCTEVRLIRARRKSSRRGTTARCASSPTRRWTSSTSAWTPSRTNSNATSAAPSSWTTSPPRRPSSARPRSAACSSSARPSWTASSAQRPLSSLRALSGGPFVEC